MKLAFNVKSSLRQTSRAANVWVNFSEVKENFRKKVMMTVLVTAHQEYFVFLLDITL